MTKLTPEEVSLCKQVAEKHKKEVKYGDWYLNEKSNIPYLWKSIPPFKYIHKNIIPLWTISDCLEFFDKRDMEITINHFEEGGWRIQLWKKESQAFYSDYSTSAKPENKTPLEACLKAVLAVLEEEGK